MRLLAYPQTGNFLVCFSIDCRTLFESARITWVPEVRAYISHVPTMLLGLKGDLRTSGGKRRSGSGKGAQVTVEEAEAEELARGIGAVGYYEVCALTGVREPVTAALRFVRSIRDNNKRERRGLWRRCWQMVCIWFLRIFSNARS